MQLEDRGLETEKLFSFGHVLKKTPNTYTHTSIKLFLSYSVFITEHWMIQCCYRAAMLSDIFNSTSYSIN